MKERVLCLASLAPFSDAGAMDFCCSRMHFLHDRGWEASLFVPAYHLHMLFGERLTKAWAYFLIGLFVFLLLSFKSSLYILDGNPLSLFKSSLLCVNAFVSTVSLRASIFEFTGSLSYQLSHGSPHATGVEVRSKPKGDPVAPYEFYSFVL